MPSSPPTFYTWGALQWLFFKHHCLWPLPCTLALKFHVLISHKSLLDSWKVTFPKPPLSNTWRSSHTVFKCSLFPNYLSTGGCFICLFIDLFIYFGMLTEGTLYFLTPSTYHSLVWGHPYNKDLGIMFPESISDFLWLKDPEGWKHPFFHKIRKFPSSSFL